MPIKKTLFLLLFLIAPLLLAQHEKEENEKVNSLEKGSWSLQFRISQNFQLSSFKGQSISAKYHLSESSAVRTGITLNGSITDNDNKQVDETYDYITNNFFENDELGITFSADYLFYINSKKSINFFFGGGLLFGFSKNNGEDLHDNFRGDTLYSVQKSISEKTSSNYGLNLLAGVEWFVNSYISIHAEYDTQFYYSKHSSESKSERIYLIESSKDLISTAEHSSERFIVNPYGVKFGLSVYF